MEKVEGVTIRTKQFLIWPFILILLFASPCTAQQCTSVLDMAFLLDMSGSVGTTNWRNVLVPFVRSLVDGMEIGTNSVRTAAVIYSSQNLILEQWRFDNTALHNKPQLIAAVNNLANAYRGGTTFTGAGLNLIRTNIMWGAGSRGDAPKLLVLLTDGHATDAVATPAANLRNAGSIIVVVGIANANARECRTIAGCQPDDVNCRRFIGTDWNRMNAIVNDVLKSVCESLPVDAVCSEWMNWSNCSMPCGDGIQERRRRTPLTVRQQVPGSNGSPGKTCEQQDAGEPQGRACNLGPCKSDAVCGSFGGWSCCTRTCGGGTQERRRSLWNNPPAQHGGRTCEQQGLTEVETQACNTAPCAIDAVPGPWSEWSSCSVTCGFGTHRRTRSAMTQQQHGGLSLAAQHIPVEEIELCQNFPCGPCHYKWAEWTPCTQTCGNGYKSRHRSVKFDFPTHMCPAELFENQNCSIAACVIPTIPIEPEVEEGKGGGNTAALAGGIVGGVAVLGATAGGAYYYRGGDGGAPEAQEAESFTEPPEAAEDIQEYDESVTVDADSDFWQAPE